MPMQTPPMGLIQLQQRARQGDPQAIQMLQELQGGQGMPLQGQTPMPGPGGMSQSQFGNGGGGIPADAQARKTQQLIEMLRRRDQGMMAQ